MPTGITALEKTLIGVEALAGSTTDVVTTHWRGTGKIKDTREVMFPEEKVGRFGGTTRSYIPATGSEVTLEGDATYEQMPYVFNAGVYLTTPTTDASSGLTYTWNVQTASTDAFQTTDLGTLVVESGDNVGVEIARYCFVKNIVMSGKQGEALMVNADLEGREPTTSASFTAVGTTDLENVASTILFSKVRLYIDDSTGTIGTTQVSETILDSTLNFKTGWVALPAKDGRLDFSSIKRVHDEITLEVVFEHNASAETEKGNWKSETERAIRLMFTGNALTTTDAGATYDAKAFIIDLWGKWSSFGAEGLEEQDGDNIYRGTFRAGYSAVADNKARFIIVNELSSLP